MSWQQFDERAARNHAERQARSAAPGREPRPFFVAPYQRPATRSAGSGLAQVAFAAVAVLILGGCITGFVLAAGPSRSPYPVVGVATTADSADPAIAGGVGGVSTFGLPFATGTSMSISQGPHADNYRSVIGGYTFTGAADVPASLDLGTQQGVAVKPVSSGRVLSAWPVCNVVVVDQGGGIWAEYVHVQVAVASGQYVDRNTTLGYVLGAYDHSQTSCGDHSSGPHLHLAFINGSGSSGTYVPIAGRVMCGYTVDGAGNLSGLGSVGGAPFRVPDCDTTSQPAVTPTPRPVATPTPRPPAAVTAAPPLVVTPAPKAAAGSCSVPFPSAPGAGASFGSTQDVSLTWSSNCPQTYAELSGAPYGTISFGGWQNASGVHVGQMWPGTYTWHVKGRSAPGQETNWSATWTFSIRSAAGPVVTGTPAPRITDAPAPVVTDPPVVTVTPPPTATPIRTPCPFMDGGSGVTFYSGPNFTGQSWTWYVPAGNGDAYADLPSGLFRNLGSFYVSNNAWHVVLYQGENGTGNLGHYDGSWANVDAYWHNTESVKIYINRTAC
jgi:hypothetical protein